MQGSVTAKRNLQIREVALAKFPGKFGSFWKMKFLYTTYKKDKHFLVFVFYSFSKFYQVLFDWVSYFYFFINLNLVGSSHGLIKRFVKCRYQFLKHVFSHWGIPPQTEWELNKSFAKHMSDYCLEII